MSEPITIAALEAAINRCLAANPPVAHTLNADARQLADVYGESIFAQAHLVDLSRFPKQAQTVRKWLA